MRRAGAGELEGRLRGRGTERERGRRGGQGGEGEEIWRERGEERADGRMWTAAGGMAAAEGGRCLSAFLRTSIEQRSRRTRRGGDGDKDRFARIRLATANLFPAPPPLLIIKVPSPPPPPAAPCAPPACPTAPSTPAPAPPPSPATASPSPQLPPPHSPPRLPRPPMRTSVRLRHARLSSGCVPRRLPQSRRVSDSPSILLQVQNLRSTPSDLLWNLFAHACSQV